MQSRALQLLELQDTPEHILGMRDLTAQFHEEFGGSREYDGAAIVYSAKQFFKGDPDRKFSNAWIVLDEEAVVGILYATAPRVVYSWRQIAKQEMFYVAKEYRGSRAAFMLIKAFEAWAKALNCEQVYMSVEHNMLDDLTKKTSALMQKAGYKLRGYYHIKFL